MKRTVLFLTLLIFGFLLPSTFVSAADPGAEKLYNRHCAACHGIKGDGEGPAAYLLSPKPRNFSLGVYKIRSTPSGSPPTDQDLLRTLKLGIPGTAMPMWDRLPETDLVALVEYLKSFSDIFEDEEMMDPPIVIKSPPPAGPKSISAGKKVYEQMGCADCHGPGGKGDGPSAATIKDDQDRRIRPYDFTLGAGLMKGGATPQDIYRTFTTGLDGTPMPSYADSLKEDQRWQLVRYVQSLSSSGQPSTAPKRTSTVRAVNSSTNPSLAADDPIWKSAPTADVPLRPLWSRDSWVDSVKVQAIAGPEITAIRLEWRDIRKDEEVIRNRDFRDAVAIQFVPGGNPNDYIGLPFIGMGDEEKAVTIWHWKADWQADIAGGFRGVVQKYGDSMDKILQEADLSIDKSSFAGLAAANPLSLQTRKSSVEVLSAKGFGTLTSLPVEAQTVEGHGEWHNGSWVVVMQQTLEPRTAHSLKQGKPLPIAVAVWDGAAGDRNGQKSVSQWMELVVE